MITINDIDKISGFRVQADRNFPEFRRQVYEYLKYHLSNVMTDADLDIIVKIIAEIFGDLFMRTGLLPWQIDTHKCPNEYLKDLGSLIGYRWNDSLTDEQQRIGIDMYCLIRRNRGTKFGLENLIRSFGQTMKQFYSSSDLRGVEIIEYGSGGADTVEPNMFPGDIIVKIPEMSTILRDSIYDTKLAGTRLYFQYYIFIGIFQMGMKVDDAILIKISPSTYIQGFNSTLEDLGPFGFNTKLWQMLEFQLTHGIRGNYANYIEEVGHIPVTLDENHHGNLVAGVQILTYYKVPWINGFILNVPGLTNYRGYLQPSGIIHPDEIMYK